MEAHVIVVCCAWRGRGVARKDSAWIIGAFCRSRGPDSWHTPGTLQNKKRQKMAIFDHTKGRGKSAQRV